MSTTTTKKFKFKIIVVGLLIAAVAGVSILITNTVARPLAPGEQHATSSPFSPIINEQFPSEIKNSGSSPSGGN